MFCGQVGPHISGRLLRLTKDQWDIIQESFYLNPSVVKAYLVPSVLLQNRQCVNLDTKGVENLFDPETGANIGMPTGIFAKKCVGEIAGHYDVYILNRIEAHHLRARPHSSISPTNPSHREQD